MFNKLFHSTLYFLLRINTLQAILIVLTISFPLYFRLFSASIIHQAIYAAQLGTVYLLLAFILYIFLIIIRRLIASDLRRKIVIFTRIFIRFHIAFAILGVLFVLYHIYIFFPYNRSLVQILGILTFITLIPLLISGYLRKQKASGRRRKSHRYTAFIFLTFLTLHIIF